MWTAVKFFERAKPHVVSLGESTHCLLHSAYGSLRTNLNIMITTWISIETYMF